MSTFFCEQIGFRAVKQFRKREKQNFENNATTISKTLDYDDQTITEESKVLQHDVNQENLGKFIPVLAVINIAGFFVISFLNNLWPMQGELTNYPGEFLSLTLGIISLIAGIIFFFGDKSRWRAAVFATIIASCNYIMLGYLLVQAPNEDWTFGYLGIVIVACGVFFSQKFWWIFNLVTG